ncbi:MAG: hypothetical protein ACI9FN_001577 [Saprospiraceae bacterium]|jgi:hypothetical protein
MLKFIKEAIIESRVDYAAFCTLVKISNIFFGPD